MPEGKQHIDTEKVIQHWYAMSEKDFASMHKLFDIKESALMLKAIFMQTAILT